MILAGQPIMPVPLFVTARGLSGPTSHVLLRSSSSQEGSGPFYCQVLAPNGDEAEGVVEQLDYNEVAKLFGNIAALAVDHEGSGAPGERSLRSIGLQLWSAGKPLELRPQDLELVQDAPGIAQLRLAPARDVKVDHVQLWSAPGAVTVTAWPEGGSLFPLPGLPNVQRKVRPVVLGRNLECSAYWGFYRHSVLRAARQLGSEMLARVTSASGGACRDELLVAAHYALNFQRPTPDVLGPLALLLARHEGADTAILLWSIAFSGHTKMEAKERQVLFERTINALADQGCLYTEVFRMLIQRLGDGEEQWREQAGEPPDTMERAIQWVRQLAAATYWDAEYLTYRAIDPHFPDAKATDDQLDIGAKKKSAVFTAN